MYGLVNKALKEMVCDRFGTDTWKTIKEKAEMDVDTFLSMEAYPDDLTHKLVGATGEVLGISSSEILEALGEYWVLYSAQKYYGHMLNMAGKFLPKIIQKIKKNFFLVCFNF